MVNTSIHYHYFSHIKCFVVLFSYFVLLIGFRSTRLNIHLYLSKKIIKTFICVFAWKKNNKFGIFILYLYSFVQWAFGLHCTKQKKLQNFTSNIDLCNFEIEIHIRLLTFYIFIGIF